MALVRDRRWKGPGYPFGLGDATTDAANSAALTNLYQTILGRQPDAAGFAPQARNIGIRMAVDGVDEIVALGSELAMLFLNFAQLFFGSQVDGAKPFALTTQAIERRFHLSNFGEGFVGLQFGDFGEARGLNLQHVVNFAGDIGEAALRGAKEIGFTVLSISISLVAVFLPLLLMEGMIGRLFREFSVTLAAAVLISMVISLITTPMLCSLFLRHQTPKQDASRGFQRLTQAFQRRVPVKAPRCVEILKCHQPRGQRLLRRFQRA